MDEKEMPITPVDITTIDSAVTDHLDAWLEREFVNSDTRLQMHNEMLRVYATHPEYWGSLGWSAVLDAVDFDD